MVRKLNYGKIPKQSNPRRLSGDNEATPEGIATALTRLLLTPNLLERKEDE